MLNFLKNYQLIKHRNTRGRGRILATIFTVILLAPIAYFLVIRPLLSLAAPSTPNTFWNMDEGYGTTLNDNSGNSNSGTISGASWANESVCLSHKCLSFDGSNDFVSVADDADFDFAGSDSFTLSVWIKHGTQTSGQDIILAKYETSGGDGGYKLLMEEDGDITCGIDNDNSSFPSDSVTSTDATYDDNRWHHVACVKSGSSSLSMYIDGVLIGTDSSITSSSLENNDTFYLGIDGDGTSNPWLGLIDEFKLYRSALTESEIRSIHNDGAVRIGNNFNNPLVDGLIGYWKLDETSGNASDSSGNGYTLTNNGTTTYVGAKFGSGSEHVPASSQYLSTTTTLNGVHSVSFWTNPDNTTNYFVSLTSGAYLTSSAGTISATGFTNPTIYVNGVASTTLAADVWQLVTVTTDTAINADQFYVGRQGSNYYDGTLDEVRLYSLKLTPSQIQAVYSFTAGPVGYWKFDEASGQNIFDSSGNGLSGTLGTTSSVQSTDPTWAVGKFGGALRYDGSDDLSRVADNSLLDFTATKSFTISVWVRRTGSANFNNPMIIASKQNRGGSGAGYELSVSNNGSSSNCDQSTSSGSRLCLSLSDGTDTYFLRSDSNLITNDSTWHHVAVTLDRNSEANTKVYVDGVEQAVTKIGTFANLGDISNSVPLCIGKRVSGANCATDTTHNFNGLIDELKIYDYVRSQAQIIEDMNGGNPIGGSPVGSAVAYWQLDEMNGTTAFDRSSNDNDLTLSTSSWTTSGKYNGAWNGTGANWLSRADDSDFDVSETDNYSVSLWFKSDSSSNPGSTEYIFNKANATTAGYAIYANTSGQICFGIDDDTTWGPDVASCSTTDFYDNSWHHVVAVRDISSDTISIYIDGLLRDSDSDTTTATLANSLSLYIGDRDGSNNGDEFTGDIDEIKVFRASLTDDQIKMLYSANSVINLGTGYKESDDLTGGAGNPPIFHWNLDDNTGTTVADKSGNGVTGTFTGTPSWVAGKYGSALQFPGDDSNIVTSSATITGSSTITMSFWLKTTASTSSGASVNWNGRFCRIGGVSSGKINCAVDNSTAGSATSTSDINDNEWHHIAITSTAGAQILYIDGIAEGSATETLITTTNSINRIGGGVTLLPHTIDDFKIYNYVLSPTQINYEYNRGAPSHWYKMDDCTGTVITNNAKNANDQAAGNNGTLTIGASGSNTSAGTCSSGTGTEAWNDGTTGKRNFSIFLDGTDDSIDLPPSNVVFPQNSNWTQAVWFKHDTGSISGAERILTFRRGATGSATVMFYDSSSSSLLFRYHNGSFQDDTVATVASLGTTWHHLATTYDGTTFHTYLDGNLIVSSVDSFSGFSSGTAGIGYNPDGPDSYWEGQIDDVKFFQYPLSQDQIKKIMNEGAVRFGPNQGAP